MRDVFHADLLRHGDEAVHAHVGHGFVRALHGVSVEFNPAGVRQFDKPAGGGGKPFEIGLGQFHAFGLPFGGDGQPVNAAAFDDEARLERARLRNRRWKAGLPRNSASAGFVPTPRRARRENFHWRRRSTDPAPA